MADPFRLRVLQSMTALIKTITPDNGYQHDLSDFLADGVTKERVFRGRAEFGFGDPRPMVSVLEHPRALEQLLGTSASTSATGDWDLLIQGFAEDDPEHPTDPAHRLAADVIMCLAKEKATRQGNLLGFGARKPCVTNIKIGQAVVRPFDEGISDVAYFFLTVSLTLVEDQENPYA